MGDLQEESLYLAAPPLGPNHYVGVDDAGRARRERCLEAFEVEELRPNHLAELEFVSLGALLSQVDLHRSLGRRRVRSEPKSWRSEETLAWEYSGGPPRAAAALFESLRPALV